MRLYKKDESVYRMLERNATGPALAESTANDSTAVLSEEGDEGGQVTSTPALSSRNAIEHLVCRKGPGPGTASRKAEKACVRHEGQQAADRDH